MADPLQTLLRLRRLAVDEARRGLAESLRQETEASERARTISAGIDRETDLICQAASDDRLVDHFAAWLRRARVEQDEAARALLAAETQSQEARAVLTAGRAAVEAAEALIERREAERVAEEERAEQKRLDEAGRGRGV
jgi:flagellar export protein FliJ